MHLSEKLGFGWNGFIGRNNDAVWRPHRGLYGIADKHNAGPFLTNEELLELGHLIDNPNNAGVPYHIINLPWNIEGSDLGKENWNEIQWGVFEQLIKFRTEHPKEFEEEKFSSSVPAVIRGKDVRAVGKLNMDLEIHGTTRLDKYYDLKNAVVKGDFYCKYGGNFDNIDIDGNVFAEGDIFINGNISGLLTISGSQFCENNVICDTVTAEKIEISKNFRKVFILMCASGVYLKNFESDTLEVVDSEKVYFFGCTVNKSATLKELRSPDESKYKYKKFSGLSFCNFSGNLDLKDYEGDIVDFNEIDVQGSFDFSFKDYTVDEKFNRELDHALNIKRRGYTNKLEYLGELEKACQRISEWHGGNGRKGLSIRYRRYALICQANGDLNISSNVLFKLYNLFSDYGISIKRPLVSLTIFSVAFFAVYWALASYTIGLGLYGNINCTVFYDAMRLSVSRIFPFGLRMSSESLFHNEVLVPGHGISVVFWLITGLQSLLSAVMLFLTGLAIRTRLLLQ